MKKESQLKSELQFENEFFYFEDLLGLARKRGEGLGHSLMGAPLLYLLNFALNFGALQQAAAINLEAQQALRASK